MLISQLPEPIKARALECLADEGLTYDPFDTVGMFWWVRTKEGHVIWAAVELDNFTPFYEFHGIRDNDSQLTPG